MYSGKVFEVSQKNHAHHAANNKVKIGKNKKTSNYDIPYYVTDNKKISKFYNWLPKKNIDQIIQDVYFWIISERNVLRFFK